MIIYLKNKHTLKVDDFYFKCSIGKNGLTKKNKHLSTVNNVFDKKKWEFPFFFAPTFFIRVNL